MRALLVWFVGVIVKRLIRFPKDWRNSEQVRLFVVHNGDTLRALVRHTETNIDDRVVEYLVALANNKVAWDLAFNTIVRVMGDDNTVIPPTPPPDSETDVVRPLRALLARIRSRVGESGE